MDIRELLSLIISSVMMVVGVTTFIISLTRNSKKEGVNTNVKEIKSEIKNLSVNLQEIDKRLTTVEANLKTAFMRIDELKAGKADKE